LLEIWLSVLRDYWCFFSAILAIAHFSLSDVIVFVFKLLQLAKCSFKIRMAPKGSRSYQEYLHIYKEIKGTQMYFFTSNQRFYVNFFLLTFIVASCTSQPFFYLFYA